MPKLRMNHSALVIHSSFVILVSSFFFSLDLKNRLHLHCRASRQLRKAQRAARMVPVAFLAEDLMPQVGAAVSVA